MTHDKIHDKIHDKTQKRKPSLKSVKVQGNHPKNPKEDTLPETNSLPLKIGHHERKFIFQPLILRGYVRFREGSIRLMIIPYYIEVMGVETPAHFTPMKLYTWYHQHVQAPKMEGFLNLMAGYLTGWGFPYISRIRTAFIGEDSEPFEVPNEMFGDLSSEMFPQKEVGWLLRS